MEDREIIDLYWQRAQEAVTETERKYGAYLRTIAFHILRSREDAEESLNDTYYDAWNSMPPLRPVNLQGFLGQITRRRSIDRWRRDRTKKRGGDVMTLALEELEGCIPGGGSPEERLQDRELGRCIDQFLRMLPVRERQVFIRRYWYMDSIQELCRSFGLGQSQTKSMLLRTRRRLRDYLEERGALDAAR